MPPQNTDQLSPGTAKPSIIVLGIFLSLILFFFALLAPRIFSFSGSSISKERSLFYSRIILWIWFLFFYAYVVKIEKQKITLWPQKKYSILFYIASIFLFLLCITIGSIILSKVEGLFGLSDNSKKLSEILLIFKNNKPLLLFTIFTAAVLEELYFRGYLVSRLQTLFKNSFLSIVVSSLLFGLAHLGFHNAAQMINVTFIGIVSSWYFLKYRNITVLIICHFLIDFIGIYSRLRS